MSCDIEQAKDTLRFLFWDSLGNARKQQDQDFSLLRRVGTEYYLKGVRAFDLEGGQVSPHLEKTMERLSIRVPMLDAIDLLERERDQLSARFESSLSLVSLGARLAPSVGMLGTIIGMSMLLSHLKDPESIGASMSVALLTTFYGLFFSLALWTPVQHHLTRLLSVRMRSYEQALHWLDLLQQRKPADYLGEANPDSSPGRGQPALSQNQELRN